MDAVEEVKSRLNIEDVIGEYVTLKRAGRNFKGLSPFTAEKTPSFVVSPDKQIWHDFSSGKGGSVFSFVMEMEGLDFRGALELLARKAGVDLEQYGGSSKQNSKLKERLYEANEAAAKFYQVQLTKQQNALKYVLETRKFSKKIILEFRLGYSPNTGTALLDYLTKKGFNQKELSQTGLITTRYRAGDMFRGRLMIPLLDAQGRVVGFTARQLDGDPKAPKYINTPQTMLYDKGRQVFGLSMAKEAIRKNGFVVVAEGNLDVVASHQAGVRQVVATAGTAMTEMQLKALGRFTHDVRLCFDADRAGLAATERVIPMASKAGVSISVISVEGGKDPDELIRQSPETWQKIINKADYALDWLIERQMNIHGADTAVGKRGLADTLVPILKGLQDPVEQEHYIDVLSKKLKVGEQVIRQKLSGQEPTRRKQNKLQDSEEGPSNEELEYQKIQDRLLALLLMQPALRMMLPKLDSDMFSSEQAREVFSYLKDHPNFAATKEELAALRAITDYVKVLSLQYETLYQGLELLELRNEAARMQARLIEHYVKSKKQALLHAMEEASEDQQLEYLKTVKELDELLKLK